MTPVATVDDGDEEMTNPFTSPRLNRHKYQAIAHVTALTSAIVMGVSKSFGSPVAVGNFCWVGADTQARSDHISYTQPSGSTTGIWVFIVTPASVSMTANLYVTLVSYGRFRRGVSASLRNRRVLLREGFLTTVTLIAYSALLWGVYGAYWLTPSPIQARRLSRLFAFLLSYRGSVPFILWCLYKRPQRKRKINKPGVVVDGAMRYDKSRYPEEGEDDDDAENVDDDAVRPQMNLALLDELVFYTTHGIAKAVRITSTLGQLPSAASSYSSPPADHADQPEGGPAQYSFLVQPSPEDLTWNQCRFTAFRPLEFQRIRRFFGIEEDAYLSSLKSCTTPKVSEGASGSFVFYSADRSYVVKSLTGSESTFLHGMLKEYTAYIEDENGESFLTRFLGSYCIELYGRPVHFVVMENVFDVQQGISIHQRYDIKGSWVDRNAQKPRRGAEATCRHCNLSFRCGTNTSRSNSIEGEKQQRNVCPNRAGAPHEPNVVLKDMDLTMKLRFGKNAGRKLLSQLMRDSDFLCARGVMDYSLLLGVIEVSYLVNRHNILTRDGSVFLPPDVFAAKSNTPRSPSGNDGQQQTDTESPNERVKQSTQCLRAAEVVIGPGFYYIGVIDILQTWNLSKRIERFVKTVIFRKDPDGISAMPPKPYRDRFHRKLREIIHLGHNSSIIPPAPATVEGADGSDEGILDDDAFACSDKRAIRREQCRANQARYRNKQLKIKRQLRQELQRLEEEIHGLRLKKRSIRFERKTNQSPWTIVSEALRLIEDGFRSPWRLANLDEMMKHSDTRQTLEFLQKSFVHDVRFGDLRGINALMDQWRRYSLYFEDPHLELQQVNVLTAGVFCAAATFSVTITEFTLRCVFPHLIDDEGHGGKVDTAPLQDRLLGERVEFKCSMRFFFDELNGRVVRLEPTVDWIPPLVRLLDGLESVSAVLGTALVSPNCVVGDIP
ncbi:hypothetical protein JM16_008806 [Phytophthora kernoviae]|uniref:PIPK domain-containing protein n=1 Tax=Phytophthora kernoviae TaxID=325452 RepID=A0A8T0LK67_9STRA|nr:hypothetical protein JM16_008806 [Phytophthora kernoviae]